MDDIYVYLLAGVVIVVFIIVLNHKTQKNKVTTFLKDARDAQPVFMQQAVEKKLKTLKIALYGNNTGIQLDAAVLEGGALSAAETKKQSLTNELEQLEKNYAAGGITLKAYDEQLHQLITKLS